VASQDKLTVALDVHITEELKEKGLARELVNRIQNLRKDKGFAVTDRITVRLKGPDSIVRSVTNNLDYIRTEILATSLEFTDHLSDQEGDTVEVDDDLHVLTSINKN
jgi:isoleucyl-tRNA synthetase